MFYPRLIHIRSWLSSSYPPSNIHVITSSDPHLIVVYPRNIPAVLVFGRIQGAVGGGLLPAPLLEGMGEDRLGALHQVGLLGSARE